ncbi:hypothetical protein GCM10027299_25500 [Larkinella ripae]
MATGGPYLSFICTWSGRQSSKTVHPDEDIRAGLAGIRQRYGQLTSRPVLMQQNEHQMRVQIPLLSGEFRYL